HALIAFVDRLTAAAGDGANELNLIVTNGRILCAARRGRPMALLRTTGLSDCPVCREAIDPGGREGKRAQHEHLRSVLLVSDGPTFRPPPGAEEVPEGSIVAVTHLVQAAISPLAP